MANQLVDLFRFMAIRAPQGTGGKAARIEFIHDDDFDWYQ